MKLDHAIPNPSVIQVRVLGHALVGASRPTSKVNLIPYNPFEGRVTSRARARRQLLRSFSGEGGDLPTV